ncbi:AGAP013392-PA-like protein [Anopheles sinensis]|uniref:AGAP013392-PA-like protein n=1 Tax=Anopheles sinensis TaxID=74873 RepID=A0A084VNX4_ANOSI|nr:AGAP013392-PA-like protein [Anopheles sinensis]
MQNYEYRGRLGRCSSAECLAVTGTVFSKQNSNSAPDLVDHESEVAFVIHRYGSSYHIPQFNYHDCNNPPTSSSTPPTCPTMSPMAPVEYGEYQATPSSIKVRGSIGFLDDFVPQKGRRLRKHCPELDPFEGQCRYWPDSPLERIHPEQGCIPILKAVYFTRNNNDLDKENAHFKLAEALISTFELLKWKSCLNRSSSQLLSNLDWDSANEPSPTSAVSFHDPSTNSDESCEAIEAKETTCDMKTYSAEEIAISLLNKFQDKQLPSAGDFLWLVSEQDAPQKILPMPSGAVIDPDDVHPVYDTSTLIRGTQEWAPPRAQVIFTYKPQPLERREHMKKQGNRCEGCGIKVNKTYMSRYRYCHYTGKFNCSGCHKNQMAIIPARVIHRWDFAALPVSVFAYRVLGDIWSTPLYRVNHLFPGLYSNVKMLRNVRQTRVNMKYVKDFIMNCRHSESLRSIFQEVPEYFTSDFDMWSMADFLAVKNGTLARILASIIARCEKHILSCELCRARGFVCEKCIGQKVVHGKHVLFPWQPKVFKCEQCGTCYHAECWRRDKSCNRCYRMHQRAATGTARNSS